MKVYLSMLGCKLNQAELEAAARQLRADGHEVVDRLEDADVHVVNTCTVTHAAARDSRKLARRGARTHARLRTVLTGCWATEKPDQARALPGVELVVDNHAKHDLVSRIYGSFPELAATAAQSIDHRGSGALGQQRRPSVPVSYVPLAFGNTRAALKIEDGCNMRCAFCIIPATRGRQVSRRPDEAIEELRQLSAAGVREVVITGVQISSYRSQGLRLHDLVRRMLDETDVPRLRLTSIAPWQFDRRLMDLWQDERLCRHVHLSLQSGCTETLRRMRRPYTADQYAQLLLELRQRVPHLAVTTDVIVGFPGECDDEYEQSIEFVEQCGFARTHVFTYSEREGTLAAEMTRAVPHPLRKERTARMIEVGEASRHQFEVQQVGTEVQVLWEDERAGRLRGTTDNYLRVQARLQAVSHRGEASQRRALVRLGAPSAEGYRRRPGQLERVTLRRDGALGLVA